MRQRFSIGSVLVGAMLATAGLPAIAADNGFYLGLAATDSKVDNIDEIDEFVGELDLSDTSFKIIAGMRPLDWFAVEANYIDLGSEQQQVLNNTGIDIEAKAYAVYGIGFLQLEPAPIDLFGKIGVARWEVDGSVNSILGRFTASDSGTELAYGGGAQVRLGSLALRAEYETFDIDNSDGLDLFSLGFTWTFL